MSGVTRQAAALTDRNSYRIIYSRILEAAGNSRIYLILLVGAARFELATPCAQGSCVASKGSIHCCPLLCLQQLGESAFRPEASPRSFRSWGFGTVLAQSGGFAEMTEVGD
jgi:hypothetical protein